MITADSRSLFWGGCILYTVGFIYALAEVIRSRRYPRSVLLSILGAGFVMQTAALYWRGYSMNRCPLGNPFEFLQFMTWSTMLLYLVVGPAFRMSLLGFFTSGLAAGVGLVSLLVVSWDRLGPRGFMGGDPLVQTHASTALFSYGVFGLLALTSAMYLIQNFGLKRKRHRGMFPMLPSVLQLDQMSGRLLLAGVSVLSFSLLIGALTNSGSSDMAKLIKLGLTTAVWAAYFLLLLLRWVNRLVSTRFAWTSILLFLIALGSLWPVDRSRLAAAPVPSAELDEESNE